MSLRISRIEMMMIMVSGYVKGHDLYKLSEIGWSFLDRGEYWAGREDMGFVLLYDIGGMMKAENLRRDDFFWAGAEWVMVGNEVVV